MFGCFKSKVFEILKYLNEEQQYHVVLLGTGSAGAGFGSGTTGKLGRAWHRCLGGA